LTPAIRAVVFLLRHKVKEFGVIQLAKSLLRDDTSDACQVAGGYLHAWSRPLIELLREFRVGTTSLIRGASRTVNNRGMTDYSRMTYDALRKIADNDAIADKMSNEEYESLSTELWRKFSAEKLTAQVS